jgi:hypothetical protein
MGKDKSRILVSSTLGHYLNTREQPMKTKILTVLMLLWSSTAFAQQPGTACFYAPAELTEFLGHTPGAGVASLDRFGMPHCKYAMQNAKGIYFYAYIRTKCNQAWFEGRVKLHQSTSGKPGTPLNGIGDGASFLPGAGTALARVGAQCIELSGLRAGAKRVVTAADAEKLLALAVARIGKQ